MPRIHSKVPGLLAILWMAVIFFLSSRPAGDFPPLFWGADKLVHLVLYGVLGVLLSLAFGLQRGARSWSEILFVSLLVMLYGISDEYHQSLVPGRHPSVGDVTADVAGGFIAAFCVQRYRWWPIGNRVRQQ